MRGTILVGEVHKDVWECTKDMPWVREGVQICARGVVTVGKVREIVQGVRSYEKCHTGEGECAWNVAWVRKSAQRCQVV